MSYHCALTSERNAPYSDKLVESAELVQRGYCYHGNSVFEIHKVDFNFSSRFRNEHKQAIS